MIRHIVMVNYKEGFSPEQNRENAKQVEHLLEGLKDVIPGIIEFDVIIDALPSSDKDIVFNTLSESVEALAAYKIYPAHMEVASFVASVMWSRTCIDYHEKLGERRERKACFELSPVVQICLIRCPSPVGICVGKAA